MAEVTSGEVVVIVLDYYEADALKEIFRAASEGAPVAFQLTDVCVVLCYCYCITQRSIFLADQEVQPFDRELFVLRRVVAAICYLVVDFYGCRLACGEMDSQRDDAIAPPHVPSAIARNQSRHSRLL